MTALRDGLRATSVAVRRGDKLARLGVARIVGRANPEVGEPGVALAGGGAIPDGRGSAGRAEQRTHPVRHAEQRGLELLERVVVAPELQQDLAVQLVRRLDRASCAVRQTQRLDDGDSLLHRGDRRLGVAFGRLNRGGDLTNRFRKDPPYAPSRQESLSPPTHSTRHIVGAAIKGLKEIYREGLAYKRAGVMLLDLMDARQGQPSLFERPDPKDGQLIEAMDVIERRMGPGAIRFGHSVSTAR